MLIKEYISEEKKGNEIFSPRLRHFHKLVENLGLKKSMKAVKYVEEQMSIENGFSRHNGSNYYIHPIAIAQTAIDFGLVDLMINNGEKDRADALISVCLLHDVIEDVEGPVEEYISDNFGSYILQNVQNVTKKEKGLEDFDSYLMRVISSEISSLVKILDQLNNISTMSGSSLRHRKKHAEIAREYYIPLIKYLRQRDYQYGRFYYQVRTIINSILLEIERGILLKEELLKLKSQ